MMMMMSLYSVRGREVVMIVVVACRNLNSRPGRDANIEITKKRKEKDDAESESDWLTHVV